MKLIDIRWLIGFYSVNDLKYKGENSFLILNFFYFLGCEVMLYVFESDIYGKVYIRYLECVYYFIFGR